MGSFETRSSYVLVTVREVCYRLRRTCLFQRSPPVLKERGARLQKRNVTQNLRNVQVGNKSWGNAYFQVRASLPTMMQPF